MVEDQFFDFEGTQGFMWMKGWRCMNCGHAADSVIEANHRLHEATVLARSPEELEKENVHVSLRAEPVTRVAA
jgi:glutamate-1-semialdehyde aminotransferase